MIGREHTLKYRFAGVVVVVPPHIEEGTRTSFMLYV